MAPLTSILIPSYNAERWIADAIGSALAQSHSRIEVIVVDDGSRDSSLSVARGFECARVKVAQQENRGASAARNHAYRLCQGDYIQWLDADDVLRADKIKHQIEAAEGGRRLLSGAWGRFQKDPGSLAQERTALWEDLTPFEWLCRKMEDNLWMAIESWLVPRELSVLAGPWDEELSLDDDGDYFRRVVAASGGVKFVPESLCAVRREQGASLSSMHTLPGRKLESQAKSLKRHVETLLGMENSERSRAASLALLQRWALYFYPERRDLFEELRTVARSFGGELQIPTVRAKYRILQKLFGLRVAKAAQFRLPALRSSAERAFRTR